MNHYPTTWDLVTLWLTTHFKNEPCLVLSNVMGCSNVKGVLDSFVPERVHAVVVAGEYAIVPTGTTEAAVKLCNSVPDSDPFAFVWDGEKVVHENT